MGMYDNLLVNKSLLDNLIKGTDLSFDTSDGYYLFQTKDLDNALTSFFIEEDGSFFWEKREYEYKEPTPDSTKKWNFGHLELIGDPTKEEDHRHTYIDFYDFFNTEKERVFVTFTAHVKNGKLAEPIIIKKIERDDLEQEAIRHKKQKVEWDKVRSTWQWKLASLILSIRHSKIVRLLDRLDIYLREQAKKSANLL